MPGMTIIQVVVTAYLVGLIWLIQLIHYPAFRWIAADRWADFHHAHTAAMGLLAGGPMIISLLVGGWLSWQAGPTWNGESLRQHLALGCEILAWAVTFLISVPLHAKLAGGPDPAAIELLILSNWARTAGWTVKLAVLLYPAR